MRSLHVHFSVFQGEGQAQLMPHTCDWNLRIAVHALSSLAPLFFSEKNYRLQLMPHTFDWNLRVVHALSSCAPLCSSGKRTGSVDASYL